MENIKELYSKNINIMKYFREHGGCEQSNSMDAVLCAYDYQAGSYTENYYSDKVIKNTYIYEGKTIELTSGDYTRLAARNMAKEMNKLDFDTMLEVGVGEATTICDIMSNLKGEKKVWGIELSLSRLLYAQKFSKEKNKNINLAVGDMFNLPFEDNSIDLVFTYYCIDAHRGKEKQAIEEMLRVSKEYLILVEPSYELGNEATKKRIDEQCYIKNLKNTLDEVDAEIIEHRLFDIFTANNNAAITILKKKDISADKNRNITFACPSCKVKMKNHNGNLFCPNCYNVYPVIDNIPVLLQDSAILCNKYLDF